MKTQFHHLAFLAAFGLQVVNALPANQYFAGDGSAFNAAKWGNSAGGPFTANFTNGNVAYFSTVNGTGSGSVGITVAGIVATENHTHSSPSGTLLNQGNAVVPVTVAAGKVFDLSTAAITTSATAGYIKNGAGALVWAGGSFGGGFTLNDGFLISRGVNAMGVGPLVINGGAIGGTASRDFSGKFSSVTIGGDFQFGVLSSSVAVASSTANLTFDADFNLGSALRTITIGGNGTYTMTNVFTGTGGAGVVVTNAPSATGTIALQKTNNYPGPTVLAGGNVTVNAFATFGDGTGVLRFAGGVLGVAGTRSISSDFINNPIELTASSTIRSTGGTDNTSRIVVFSSGSVTTLDGTLTLQNGAASATNNVFEVRLLGGGFVFSRPINLDSGVGTGNFARLYLGGSNTAAPQTISGVISGNGQIRRSAVTASTAGTSILTAANTYSGGTDVIAGTLLVNNTSGSGTGSGTVTVSSTGILGGTGSIGGPVTITSPGTLAPGSNGIGTLTVANSVSLGGVTRMELNRINAQTADKLVRSGGALAFGGTLTITNVGPTPVNGDVFDLFDADSFSGSFSTINLPPGGAAH
ncbi:MAG: beta strand repeat-containing protein, partial [Limisphaerales bacterium]